MGTFSNIVSGLITSWICSTSTIPRFPTSINPEISDRWRFPEAEALMGRRIKKLFKYQTLLWSGWLGLLKKVILGLRWSREWPRNYSKISLSRRTGRVKLLQVQTMFGAERDLFSADTEGSAKEVVQELKESLVDPIVIQEESWSLNSPFFNAGL